jgi:hypothetical protein
METLVGQVRSVVKELQRAENYCDPLARGWGRFRQPPNRHFSPEWPRLAPAFEGGQRVFVVRCLACGHAGTYSLDYDTLREW